MIHRYVPQVLKSRAWMSLLTSLRTKLAYFDFLTAAAAYIIDGIVKLRAQVGFPHVMRTCIYNMVDMLDSLTVSSSHNLLNIPVSSTCLCSSRLG